MSHRRATAEVMLAGCAPEPMWRAAYCRITRGRILDDQEAVLSGEVAGSVNRLVRTGEFRVAFGCEGAARVNEGNAASVGTGDIGDGLIVNLARVGFDAVGVVEGKFGDARGHGTGIDAAVEDSESLNGEDGGMGQCRTAFSDEVVLREYVRGRDWAIETAVL
jgi:hypothetical protein